jgi:hypothetical protein
MGVILTVLLPPVAAAAVLSGLVFWSVAAGAMKTAVIETTAAMVLRTSLFILYLL